MKTGDAKRDPDRPKSRRDAQREREEAIERFRRPRIAESDYGRRLRQVAKAVGHIVSGMAPKGIVGAHLEALSAALEKYATLIEPWARAVAGRMLADVSQRDERAWHQHGEAIGRSLRAEVRGADVGEIMRRLQADQVHLITSLPRGAAERVQRLARESLSTGRRAKELARRIRETGLVTETRATLIARTEVGKAQALLTRARALHIGSEGYRWRTARDADVRPEHRKLEGKFVRWSEPPVAGHKHGASVRAHAGEIYNCRCYAEPVLPDLL